MFNQPQLHYSVFKLSVHCQFFCARVNGFVYSSEKEKKRKINIRSGYFFLRLSFALVFYELNHAKLFVKITRRFQQVALLCVFQSRARRLPFTVPRIDVGRWEIMYAFGRSLQLIANTFIFATFIGFKSLLGWKLFCVEIWFNSRGFCEPREASVHISGDDSNNFENRVKFKSNCYEGNTRIHDYSRRSFFFFFLNTLYRRSLSFLFL